MVGSNYLESNTQKLTKTVLLRNMNDSTLHIVTQIYLLKSEHIFCSDFLHEKVTSDVFNRTYILNFHLLEFGVEVGSLRISTFLHCPYQEVSLISYTGQKLPCSIFMDF